MPKVIFSTPRFQVCQTTIGNGQVREHFYVEKPDAVSIVVVREASILLLKVARPLVGEESYEIPGGRVEANESPAAAAQRELAEETGISGIQLSLMLTLMPLPSLTTERTHIFFGEMTPLSTVARTDAAIEENISDVAFVPSREAFQLVRTGKVSSAVDACAISFFCHRQSNIQQDNR